ncbi:p66 [Soybean leaf crinkle mottle virus]|nr:p66 [Soybean leaf crinkle mottle virus]
MVLFGLDFGTTFSSLCVFKSGKIVALKQQNSAYIPTYLFLHANSDDMVYGYDAETLSTSGEIRGGFFRDLKRWVGCDESNVQEYIDKLKPHYSVTMAPYGAGSKKIPVLGAYSGDTSMTASLAGLISYFIRSIVTSACEAFTCECTGLVVSVPANYDCMQRSFTENCANLSGFTCVYMMNEPSAAALASCSKVGMSLKNLLVYDFGGGTFDVSVISARNQTFVVKASGGDMNLGGRDVDRAFREELYSIAGLPVDNEIDVSALKETLSKISFPIKYNIKSTDGRQATVMVEPSLLNKVMKPFVERTVGIMRDVFNKYIKNMGLHQSGSKVSLVLVGGSSYLPGLKALLGSIDFVLEIIDLADARAAVAAGCALYSSCITSESSMLLVDCASHNLSVPTGTGESIVLLPAGAPIPFNGTRNINLNRCTRTACYTPALFEGEYLKCARNRKIFSGTVVLSSLGVTTTVPTTILLRLETEVSSVGTVKFFIVGPSNEKILVGGKPAYDFSRETLRTRYVADLHKSNFNRVLLMLALTRTAKSRSRLTEPEKSRVESYTEVKDVEREYKRYSNNDDSILPFCRVLLGNTVQKILRGARLEELPF